MIADRFDLNDFNEILVPVANTPRKEGFGRRETFVNATTRHTQGTQPGSWKTTQLATSQRFWKTRFQESLLFAVDSWKGLTAIYRRVAPQSKVLLTQFVER